MPVRIVLKTTNYSLHLAVMMAKQYETFQRMDCLRMGIYLLFQLGSTVLVYKQNDAILISVSNKQIVYNLEDGKSYN